LPILSKNITHKKVKNQNKIQSNRLNFLLKPSLFTLHHSILLEHTDRDREREREMESDLSLLEISGEDDSLLQESPSDDGSTLNNNSKNYFLCSPLQIHGSKRPGYPPRPLAPSIGWGFHSLFEFDSEFSISFICISLSRVLFLFDLDISTNKALLLAFLVIWKI
jgi:hypothetical protein